MNTQIKLFSFKGIPVKLSLWFLLLFLWLSPPLVISLLISILLHEIGHAWMAKKRGYEVTSIEIGLFAGQANMDIDSIRERDMILIAGAGPWVNLVLISLSLFAYGFTLTSFFYSMYIVNLFLFLFNIIPIFPLDGGRILRSFLIMKTRDRAKSITISAWISLVLSISLLTFYLVSFSVVGILFSTLFILFSMNELKWIKIKF